MVLPLLFLIFVEQKKKLYQQKSNLMRVSLRSDEPNSESEKISGRDSTLVDPKMKV
jgi:hypothetical protein